MVNIQFRDRNNACVFFIVGQGIWLLGLPLSDILRLINVHCYDTISTTPIDGETADDLSDYYNTWSGKECKSLSYDSVKEASEAV